MDIGWQGELLPQVVDVYVLHFTPSPQLVEECLFLLSEEETARANRYRKSINRDQFVVTRGLTRQVLAAYLKEPAKDVLFSVGEHGKPGVNGLNFNLANSRCTLVAAIAKTYAVGVDIEFIDRDVNLEQIARILFMVDQLKDWQSLSEVEKRQTLIESWTAKEAYCKARGLGLNHQFRTIRVNHQEIHDPAFMGGIQAQRLKSKVPTLAGVVVTLTEEPVGVRLSEQRVETLK